MPVAGRRWQAVLIVALFLVAVAAAAFGGWWYARESPPHQGPIVLISADNLAADSLTPYGATGTATPAIDALASDGVVFDRAYAHSPLTLPAYASILSGQLPFEHGVRHDAGFVIQPETQTLAELMRNRGFSTGAAVSTFLLRPESGVAQGFSFFDADEPDAVAAAEKWMGSQEGQRYLLFLQVGEAGAESAVQRVVQRLKERDLYDEATIVLVGDHGVDTAVPSLADTSLHVPLIVKQPDSGGAGRRVVAPVQHIDLLPTILDLIRAPIPSGVRGRSLRNVLDDEEGTVTAQPIYAESLSAHFRLGGQALYALTSGTRRFIRGDREEIFDLEAGGQSLPTNEPNALGLRAALERLIGDRAVGRPAPMAPADEDAYAALGYLPMVRLPGAAPIAIERAQESELVEAHRAAAWLTGEKKFDQAIERLRTIVAAQPALATVHYQIGALLLRTARYPEAAAAFAEAARLQPDSADLTVALATTSLRAGDLDRAQRYADDAIAIAATYQTDGRVAAHEIAMRVALARGDAEAAASHAAAAQQIDRAVPLQQFVRGRVAYDEGLYEDALTAYRETEEALREHGQALEGLHAAIGDTLRQLNRQEEADAQHREEQRLFPRR